MTKRIRVLRILEYTYDNVEVMDNDMQHWTCHNGMWQPNTRMTIKSAVLPLEVLDVEDT